MNNAKIALENTTINVEPEKDLTPFLRNRETELMKIIEALSHVTGSDEWKILKSYVFDGVTDSLERRLNQEASKQEVNSPELYRLQGQITWAKKYSKLEDLQEVMRVELINIRNKLNGKK